MTELQHSYPTVENGAGLCYGGCQSQMSQKALRRCGCGLVCALDLLVYLHRWHRGCTVPFFQDFSVDPIDGAAYEQAITRLRRRWLPIVYPLGTSGLALAWGFNRFFRKFGLPLRAKWAVKWEKLYSAIEEMLQRDIPVVLAVGQNFPRIWRKDKLTFYRKTADGGYRPANFTRAHFVNVTGMDECWLQVSSWGKCYYINREEYSQFAKQHSLRWLCNIVSIQEVN